MHANTILSDLQKVPLIREAKLITISAELRKKFGPELTKEVEASRRHMTAYRFVYTSQGHTVIGYIVVPKKKLWPFAWDYI